MKQAIAFLLLIVLSFSCSGCKASAPQDEVLNSLPPYETRSFYTSGGFQDYTDYGRYTFSSITEADLTNSGYFRIVSEELLPLVQLYLQDYESWISTYEDDPTTDLAKNYDFDTSCINIGDYVCINGGQDTPIEEMLYSYSIYYFDVESCVLYYFHNNI